LSKAEDRPTLAKILSHPFLAAHASKQQHILAHNLLIPFAAPLEKRLLDRFEKSNIDTRSLIQQMSEGGSGSLIGLWELSLDRARKLEEHKKKKKKRRKSQDIDIEIIEEGTVLDDSREMVSTPREMTPSESGFGGREFSLPRPPMLSDDRPQSRGSRGSKRDIRPGSRGSRSRSHSPTKGYTYRRPASPNKTKERSSAKGFFHALRNLMSEWSQRQSQKLTHKKSKAAVFEGNGLTSNSKHTLELKKSESPASKEEQKRNRKGNLLNISIHPPTNHGEGGSSMGYNENNSPIRANDEYEVESTGGRRLSRHNRPSYRRRSTSSSINSLHSRHRYSHSKTSSTSSAGSGSVSTPRHNKGSLKIVPATPPPHLLTHENAKGAGTLWGEGIVIARRRRSPFKGPSVGFMSAATGKRKQNKNGKWPEGAIKEEDEDEDEEVMEDDIEVDGDGEDLGRDSYDIAELDADNRRGADADADARSLSASV
jgi:hypothetical protein